MDRNQVVEQHYRKYYKHLVASLRPRAGQNAEDMVQEAYTYALENWDNFNPELGSFNTWFYFQLKRVNSDRSRAEQKEKKTKDTIKHRDADDGQPGFDLNKMNVALSILSRKPEDTQFIIKAFMIDGKPVKDIAQFTGRTDTAIWLVVHKFKKEVKDVSAQVRA